MDKHELEQILKDERYLYIGDQYRVMRRKMHKRYCIWMYLRYHRVFKYYEKLRNIRELSWLHRKWIKMLMQHAEREKNIWGIRSGIEIGAQSVIGERCNIWHSNVVINGIVGDDCVFHGNNVIGNKGIGKEKEIPVLGNRVDVGVGAIIIGNIRIADDCIIGAGAVVTKSFEIPGSVIVGVPATVI